MSIPYSNEEPCHVCEHLGEKQCRYTSHKKYRNQKGNQSFKVDIVTHSPSRNESSFLNNLKQKKIQFQFPSLIPPFSGYLIGLKQPDESKIFERTLIEKVLEQKIIDKKPEIFGANQPQKRSSFKEMKVEEKIHKQTKRPMSFLRHHKASLQKQPIQEPQQKQVKFELIGKPEPEPKEQQMTQTKTNQKYQSNFAQISYLQQRPNKYHFDYTLKQSSQPTKVERTKSNIKSNESSFHVEDNRFNSQTAEFLVSRVNDRQKSNFYVGNVFKDGSRLTEIEKLEDQGYKETLTSEFRSKSYYYENHKPQSLNKDKEQRKEDNQTFINTNTSYTDYLPPKFNQINHLNLPTTQPIYSQNKRNQSLGIKKQLLSTYHDFPESRINQQVPVRIQPNESIQTRRSNFQQSTSRQKLFYPIYPVYEVVYELVKVVPDSVRINQPDSFRINEPGSFRINEPSSFRINDPGSLRISSPTTPMH